MRFFSDQRGQATVEAAFLIPVFLLVLGLLLQPALLLYTHCVMNAAAAEGCRMLETNAADTASAQAYIVRRLAAIPNADVFHCGGEAGWRVKVKGSGSPGGVRVKIVNRARPLPLFGIAAGLAAQRDKKGRVKQQVVVKSRLWPSWAAKSGADPSGLAGEWE